MGYKQIATINNRYRENHLFFSSLNSKRAVVFNTSTVKLLWVFYYFFTESLQ